MFSRIPMIAIAAALVAGGASVAMAQGQGQGQQQADAVQAQGEDQSVKPYVRQYLNTLDQQPDTRGIQNQAVRQGLGLSVRAGDQQQAETGQGQGQQRQAGQRQQQALRDLPPGTVVYVVPQQDFDPGIHDPQGRMTMRQELPTQMTPGTMALVPVPVAQAGVQERQQMQRDQRMQRQQAAQQRMREIDQRQRMAEQRMQERMDQRQQRADQRMQGPQGLYSSRQMPGSAATPYERGYAQWMDQRLGEMDRSYQAWREQTAREMEQAFQDRQQAMGQTQSGQQWRDQQDQQAQAGQAGQPGGVAYMTPQGNVMIDRMPDVPGIQVEVGR